MAASVQPGEGKWGIANITGFSISPEIGYSFAGFYSITWKELIIR